MPSKMSEYLDRFLGTFSIIISDSELSSPSRKCSGMELHFDCISVILFSHTDGGSFESSVIFFRSPFNSLTCAFVNCVCFSSMYFQSSSP